jgi:hypothetical protein
VLAHGKFVKLFVKLRSSFWLVLSSFSKFFFGGSVEFQYAIEQKLAF